MNQFLNLSLIFSMIFSCFCIENTFAQSTKVSQHLQISSTNKSSDDDLCNEVAARGLIKNKSLCDTYWNYYSESALFTQQNDYAPRIAECQKSSITICLYFGDIDGSYSPLTYSDSNTTYNRSANIGPNCNNGRNLILENAQVSCE